MSQVMSHASHVICHMSYVMHHIFIKAKWCSWFVDGLLKLGLPHPFFFLKICKSCTLCDNKQACCADCRRRPYPAEAPPVGKIDPFSKMAVTFEPQIGF